MKWNGMVSQRSQRIIASRFAIANANQASSTALRFGQAVTGMADGFDRRSGAELLAQAPDADVDDVGVGVEVVAPDLREEPLAADHLARALEQAVQNLELAVGELHEAIPELSLPAGEVERERAHAQDVPVDPVVGPAKVHAHAGQELVERERLRQVVAGAEVEPVQLSLQVGTGRDDYDGQVRSGRLQSPQHAQ